MAFRQLVKDMADGRAPMSPYDRLTGIRILSLGEGSARLAVAVDERHHNPAQVLHGGILSGLVDSAMAYAVSTVLDPADSVTNVDLTIRFLKATTQDLVTAEARVLRAGRTVVPVECDVRDSHGELIARASSSFIRRVSKGGAGWLSQPGAKSTQTPKP
jgi:uncharacterized protein (TIGR00369 family)